MQFDRGTAEKIAQREQYKCFFCARNYKMEDNTGMERNIADIMHIVPKSDNGLGIEQNGVLGCRYHHHLLDNGNKGLRQEMLGMLEEYLKSIYPGWNREDMRYKKYDF